MNKIYALVWNQAQGCWNVAHEGARRRRRSGAGKGLVVAVAGLLALAALPAAQALPSGGQVVSGSADMQTQGKHLSINQHSDKLITNWKDFNVAADQSVTFNQPTRASIALNRVIGVNGSQIHGRINANGQVFLINPNGVVFGSRAQVNVGGLVASTQNLSDADFSAGSYRFAGTSGAEIVNHGSISAADGGSVALLAAKVRNEGTVKARGGRIALAAGNAFTVSFDNDPLLDLQIDSAALKALVQNGGLLKADGGQVLMTARSAGSMLQTVVNNQGAIEANTLSQKAGRITLDGGEVGVVSVGGALVANALDSQGDGGVIETRGATTRVSLSTRVNTQAREGQSGTWKIGSDTLKVGSAMTSSSNTVHSDTLSRNLGTTDIELASGKGDISLEGAVAWHSGHQLRLSSAQDIHLNDSLKATGDQARIELDAKRSIKLDSQIELSGRDTRLGLNQAGDLALGQTGQVSLSGSGARFMANGHEYQVIQNADQLQLIDHELDGRYVLGNSIEGSEHLQSIGGQQSFSGIFDGLGNTLSGFTLDSDGAHGGLFARSSGSISNLKLASMNINGSATAPGFSAVGGLVGENSGRIVNVSASDLTVSAASEHNNVIGGLVGVNLGGSIDQSSMSGTVLGTTSTSAAGGLVGLNAKGQAGGAGSVTASSASAKVNGSMAGNALGGVGGLVGINREGLIAGSSSAGVVGKGDDRYYVGLNQGGLVGYNQGGSIEGSHSSAVVVGYGGNNAGGLVGRNDAGRITDSSASGAVLGFGLANAGGLVGLNQDSVLRNVKASATVIAQDGTHVGGLIGKNQDSEVSLAQASGLVFGGSSASVGGLIGHNTGGLAQFAVAQGNVIAGDESFAGGLVGFNSGDLRSVEALGDVSAGSKSFVGGLVGAHGGDRDRLIDGASAKGSVSGGSYSVVGGLVGLNGARIVNSLSSSHVSGVDAAYLGGLAGLNLGDIAQSVAYGNLPVVAGNDRGVDR
ncbi:two-partner secretion domain-containing protein [Pseudomonas sp. St29]|uniref:two-partner secretion domain-containing protein n=1 Tax=Pseudomonas sp. St29 TaxID=1500687 RepID=UPI0005FCB356|nr:GLUG motif-containing protein [Pseudomonas sp. St29]BAQ79417.1 adhesive protein CupB5 [Pseudomonas sp. St29]